MKIETTTDDLKRALGVVEKIAAKHLTLPVLQCAIFRVDMNRALIQATNLEVGVEIPLKATTVKEGVVAVSAALLGQITQLFPNNAKVSLTQEGPTLLVCSGGSETVLKTVSTEEFPDIPRVTEGVRATLRATDLTTAIRSVSYSASMSAVKPELASIYFTLSGQTLTAVATDSFRLAEKKLPLKQAGTVPTLLVPVRAVGDLLRVTELFDGDVEILAGDHQLALSAKGVYFTTRLVEGSFPDYAQIIPKEFSAHATVLKQDFLGALRKAAMFSDKFRQVTLSLDPKKKQLSIAASNAEVGETRETLAASLEGEALTLSFNERYLSDCFQSIPEDSISLSFAGPARPLVIRGVSGSSFLYLVMPMNR